MLNMLNDVLNNVDNFIWGMPLIILILFTGILLTVRLRGLQVRHLGKALHYVFHNEDDGEGEVTSFGALCTALSATIGSACYCRYSRIQCRSNNRLSLLLPVQQNTRQNQ